MNRSAFLYLRQFLWRAINIIFFIYLLETIYFVLIFLDDGQDVIATGGIDTNAVLFDRSSGQILCTLTGHSKKVFPSNLLSHGITSRILLFFLSDRIFCLSDYCRLQVWNLYHGMSYLLLDQQIRFVILVRNFLWNN